MFEIPYLWESYLARLQIGLLKHARHYSQLTERPQPTPQATQDRHRGHEFSLMLGFEFLMRLYAPIYWPGGSLGYVSTPFADATLHPIVRFKGG